jgi:SAM-dependent methyltransferase
MGGVMQKEKTIHEALGRNPVHPFPARMAPGVALQAVTNCQAPLRVLDPMMGSGTVIALARSQGHQAFGIDIDPLAVLISKVWTTAVDKAAVLDKAQEVLSRARVDFAGRSVALAYPQGVDEESRTFVRFWFDDYARRQLASLSSTISRVRDESVRDVLWCAFSRLIITKQAGASRAMDLSHSRPHRVFDYAPVKPFNKFLSAIELVLKNCIDVKDKGRGPAPVVTLADARKLPVEKDSIDLVLTSPPYLNAIDYMRCSKFSLVWMGHAIPDLQTLRSSSVGAEVRIQDMDVGVWAVISELRLLPRLAARQEHILGRFVFDMYKAIEEAARVLRRGGRAIYVIGENTVRGTFVPNARIVSLVAEFVGLVGERRVTRRLPGNRRYLPPPARDGGDMRLDVRMAREVILSFVKP